MRESQVNEAQRDSQTQTNALRTKYYCCTGALLDSNAAPLILFPIDEYLIGQRVIPTRFDWPKSKPTITAPLVRCKDQSVHWRIHLNPMKVFQTRTIWNQRFAMFLGLSFSPGWERTTRAKARFNGTLRSFYIFLYRNLFRIAREVS